MSDALTRFAPVAGGFGLTWLAQSTVLLILGLLAGRAARRRGPALQSAVYRTTLAAVLLCPLASNLLSAMGVEGLAIRLPQPAEEPPQQSLADLLRSDVNEEVFAPAPAPATPPSNEPPPNIVIEPIRYKLPEALADKLEQVNVPTKLAPVESPSQSNPFLIVPAAGVTLWALGTLFLLTRMLVQQARMSRVREKAVAVEPGVQAACATIAGRLGVKPPPVRRSPFPSSPCLDGLIRPMILLPEEMDDDPRDALVHELAHLARRDGWWNLARRLATAALWFQPLAWVLSRRVETTAEEVCDDVAVDLGADRTRYAELLVTIAGRSLPPSSPAAVHMIGRRSPLRRRITRILDASRPLSTRAGRLAILAVLLIGAASTAFAGLLTIGRGPKPELPPALTVEPAPKEVAAPALAEEADPSIHGRVTDEEGKPIAGATVVTWRWRRGKAAGIGLREFLPDRRFDSRTATSDADGRYSMPDFEPAPEWDDQARWTLLRAAAPGYVLGSAIWKSPFADDEVGGDFRLAKGDHPIEGRVVDLEGRPVAGARVRLRQMHPPFPPEAAGDRSVKFGLRAGSIGGPIQKALGLDGLTTDAEGRFRIPGLRRDSSAVIEIDRPDLALKLFHVLASSTEAQKAQGLSAEDVLENMFDLHPGPGIEAWMPTRPSLGAKSVVYGSEFVATMEPAQIVEGFVRDADTKQPIAGIAVAASRDFNGAREVSGRFTTTTDAEGRYRLSTPAATDREAPWISVHPRADQPYFITGSPRIDYTPGVPVKRDFELKRGQWIIGKLTEVDGRPVSAEVDYAPMAANRLVSDYLGLQPGPGQFQNGYHDGRFHTAADGTYRVLGIPGPGVVLVRAHGPYPWGVGGGTIAHNTTSPELLATAFWTNPNAFHVVKAMEVPGGDASFTCDLAVDPGSSVLLKFVDEKGAPVAAMVSGQAPRRPGWDNRNPYPHETPTTEVRIGGLTEKKARPVWIHTETGPSLAAALVVTPGPDRTVTLHPKGSVSGRYLRGDGDRAAGGVELHLGRDVEAPFPFLLDNLNAQGRFEFAAPVGGPYVLRARSFDQKSPKAGDPSSMKADDGTELARDLQVEPGKPVDLGIFKADNGQRIEEPKPVPQPAPAPAGVGLIHGRVLDDQGKPIPGATVIAWRWRRGGTAAAGLREFLPDRRFDSRTATSDADGRYSMPDFEPAPEWDFPAHTTMLCAAAQGFSVETAIWKNPNPGVAARGDVILRNGDVPITGQVVDPEGRPVAGARVRLRQADSSVPGRAIDHFDELADGRRKCNGEPIQQALGLAGQTTDADGRFRIPGLRRNTDAIIEIDRPGLAPQLVRVVARVIQPSTTVDIDPECDLEEMRDLAPVRRSMAMGASPKSSWAADWPVHGSDFTTTLAPARIVEGVVRDSETQQPIGGVVVAASRRWVDSMDAPARFVTTTDDQGRYRLAAPSADDGEAPWISVHPRADQPYFVPATARSLFAPGVPVKRDFELKRGRWIVGKLLDPDGRPVAAVVDYAPMAANPLARSFEMAPGLTRFQAGYHGDRFRTAADGSFRVLGIPGSGVVLARADAPGYMLAVGGQEIARDAQSQNLLGTSFRTLPRAFHVTKAVEIRDGDAPTSCDLKVSRSGSLLLKFVDENGAPVEAVAQGRRPSIPLAGINTQQGTDVPATEAKVVELADGEGRTIMVSSQAQGRLGVMLTVSPGPDRTVTLLPLVPVSGRVFHEDGKPAKGLVLAGPSRNGRLGEILHRLDKVWIDDQGRFEYRLPVGGPYSFLVANQTHHTRKDNGESRGASMAKVDGGFAGFYPTRDLMVEPGKPVDLGTFNADTGKPAEKKD